MDSGSGSLDDHLALELTEGRDQVNEEHPLRSRSVEGLSDRDELHAKGVKFGQGVHHVSQGPEEPVRSPHEEDVELASTSLGHEPIQLRPSLS